MKGGRHLSYPEGTPMSNLLLSILDKAGVPDVTGVAYYQTRLLVVVAVKQRYPGHAKQAAVIASQCRAAALSLCLRSPLLRPHNRCRPSAIASRVAC